MGLGSKYHQGGISLASPPRLAPQFHRLPPILHRQYPNSMPGCSKAPRGLFVLLRVGRIFTAISISPGPSLRQCSSCCAVRAGRNLPDKEFRYLRTVIVTAAVHRGFSSSLRPCGLSPCFNLPAPGRCHPLYVVFDFADSCVFVKQLQSAIRCDRFGL